MTTISDIPSAPPPLVIGERWADARDVHGRPLGTVRSLKKLWRAAGHCLLIAAANLAQQRWRLAVTVIGAAVALLLLLLQMSFLEAVRTKVTAAYDFFNFDIAITPATYQALFATGALGRVRLSQARAVPGVADAAPLSIGTSEWSAVSASKGSSLLVFAVDNRPGLVRDPELRSAFAALGDDRSVLIDDYSAPVFGSLSTGVSADIGGQRMQIAGHFKLGLFFYADGSVFVRNDAFNRMTRMPPDLTTIGLLRVAPGADPNAVKTRLVAALPGDVQVYLHDELIARERDLFTKVKPIGIILESGMVIAFLVGAVILYQVLSTEAAQRLKEHAVFKAMGFSPWFIYGMGMSQVAILSLSGFAVAVGLAVPLFWRVGAATNLPIPLSLPILAIGAGAALAMGLVSALSVLRRLMRADPASLF